ncbi:glucokinase [Methyloceanibacter sp.]|uniref:glucokinase n=1 Tax=Methyloceanibacter sp. TaxID=1965321 RepID=UPI002D45EC67|nr:glucokinase [Methyloceanibacter sp.]HZP09740.1 glucokinase [Methyloceanibacter sp.]
MELVAADIGGSHARFAIAKVEAGRVVSLGDAVVFKTAEHASLQTAWETFGRQLGRPLPRAVALAVACPISGDLLKLTNNPWIIRPAMIAERLGVDRVTLINDFGAIGHAVLRVGPEHLSHVCGPDVSLPGEGVISIVGPGSGLGVAYVLRSGGADRVIECEGGHIDYAPVDAIEDAILARLRRRYPRVSVERVLSGPGLANIFEALAAIEGRTVHVGDDKAVWTAALSGNDSLAVAALDRFCLILGSFAGNIALAHGSKAVVIAGGLGLRIAHLLPRSGFGGRFTAKGRFERLMSTIPVKVNVHPQPGLLGAVAAFAEQHS